MIFTLTQNGHRLWVLHAPISPVISILEVQIVICALFRNRVAPQDSFFVEPDFALSVGEPSISHLDLWREIGGLLPRTPRVIGVRDIEIGYALIRREGKKVFSEPRIEKLREDSPLFVVTTIEIRHGEESNDSVIRAAPTFSLR